MSVRISKWWLLTSFVFLSPAFAYDTISVGLTQTKKIIELDGTVEAVNRGTLAAQTSGRIVAVNVDVNDIVNQGDVLLEISAEQQSASLDAALAQLNSAKAQNIKATAQVRRYRELFPKGAISRERLDAAEAEVRSSIANVKQANAAVTQAKESLGYTSITAPYTGVVTQRYVELGETVGPGTQLITGFSLSPLRVVTDIPQRYRDQVEQPEQFSITTLTGETLEPYEAKLFNYAHQQSRAFKLRLELLEEPQNLLPGEWVKVAFRYGEKQSLLIPQSAAIRRGELSVVYRVHNQKVIMNPIRIGQQHGEMLEVISGLEVGDIIVSDAVSYLADK
ncbi:efflux RND transporter periplasmic adaptor subunit [Vibrio mediterranei]|jgi:RND family efflux transporter MFP subunit|uniref:Efflux RND transporter periplasmic adaptor subunit n=1 Tax=Vibrio barjaei TaxID=1676683 RepID=A0ABW7ICX1_9VIBR|nr:efflux RND transporter periplasmic adaptor subunit [Vibrio barjaei]MCG9788788.1 efflux RND transporter periplasmic adaptor subunit [Vibrio mediterranei]